MAENSVNQDSLTLERANEVRISVGLAPIGGPVAEGEEVPVDEDDLAEQNFAQRKDEDRKARAEREVKERIDKARNQRALNAKLSGSGLGAAGRDDALSTKAWAKKLAKRNQRREKDLAERRHRDMDEADRAVYDENDIAGLKVSHDADEFETGEDIVLTLKDSRVLAGEEDELQNVNMVDDTAIQAARERKRKAQAQYTGLDDEEFDEDRIGRKADVLSKYGDGYSGGKFRSEGFRLGAPTENKNMVTDEDEGEDIVMGSAPTTKVKLNLDFTKDFEVSDYVKEGDAGFKQRKKKKPKKSGRRADADDEDEANGMEVDAPSFARRRVDDGPQNLVDDDDLQAALARTRRENARRKPKMKAEDLAAQITRQREEAEAPQETPDADEDGRITFDDTSEFVRNVTLESRLAPVKREPAASPPPVVAEAPVMVKIERGEEGEVDEDDDMDSEDEDEALAEIAAREGLSIQEYRLKIDSQMKEMAEVRAEAEAANEEAVVGTGMAGVLNLLRQQGSLKTQTPEEEERERVQKQKDLWLADYRRRVAQRELDRIQARGGNKDQAQREWENKVREQTEAREALEIYKTYKPDINIVYHDEFGRQMTPKEAWKSLSHAFHGKTSGRMKTQKRLKDIAEERKQFSMASGDTPTGMTDAFARRQHKTGQAFMVLSVGNKGSVQMGDSKPRVRR